jgi:hypothetical protein
MEARPDGEAKAARLTWAIAHQDWTLEDWKNVILSDETIVVLGQRRGALRRTKYEAHHPTYIRRRWKKASEFMFWGCFTYNTKGRMHI